MSEAQSKDCFWYVSAERMCLHGKWQNPGGSYRTKSRSAANGANKFAAAAKR
jgi:hypothetical protein